MVGTVQAQEAPVQRARTRWYVKLLRAIGVLVALAALAAFGYMAYQLTLTPVHDNGWAVGNTHPGHTLRFYTEQPPKQAILQIGGNLLLLAPLGVLLPWASVRLRGPIRLGVIGFFVSLFIESIQGLAVPGRAFDIDDVILNTIGVVVAYLLVGWKLSRVMRGRRRKSPPTA
ncbi:VanZ family protein [Actinomadura parmotrematis]|uniref:VanZ family protein n=1 Tax=Actinomadura parmotrematis TaxID=2864039 RepID=A0ABS7FQ85_9ACTN|nr:VanZ family protein [Actinomadura parmotrematis]MBW8482521.1 VanZ family protein [Actinomadura parmotrematis]